jgi:hypothetical protein
MDRESPIFQNRIVYNKIECNRNKVQGEPVTYSYLTSEPFPSKFFNSE